MAIDSFGGTSSSEAGSEVYYLGGTGTFTLNLPASAYELEPITKVKLDGQDFPSSQTASKIFGSIGTVQSPYGQVPLDEIYDNILSTGLPRVDGFANSGSVMVGVGNNVVRVSNDNGQTWTTRTPSGLSVAGSVGWDGSRFVIGGGTSSGITFWESTDGVSWSELSISGSTNTAPYKMFFGPSGLTAVSNYAFYDIPLGSDTVYSQTTSEQWTQGAYLDQVTGILYVPPQPNTSRDYLRAIQTPTASSSPYNFDMGTSRTWYGVIAHNDTVIAFTESYYGRLTTDRGLTFSDFSHTLKDYPDMGAYAEGLFIMPGRDSSNNAQIISSEDGITWTISAYDRTRTSFVGYDNRIGQMALVGDGYSSIYIINSSLSEVKAKITKLGELTTPDA